MISLTLNERQINQIKADLQGASFRYDIQHSLFQVKAEDLTITVYKSHKVVFSGKEAEAYAQKFGYKKAEKKPQKLKESYPMAGSDEVGTGDYFGPVTVAACYLRREDLAKIPTEQILDSKEMSDDLILELAPLLMKELNFSLLILKNPDYNRVQKTNNLNAIKAKMHNQAFNHLSQKVDLNNSLNIIDQFVNEKKYYEYLETENQFKQLHFVTKAESQYLAVACAAIIARYAFLHEWMKMEKKYKVTFPKGSGKKVPAAARKFIQQYGWQELGQVAKLHFKITDSLKD